ncbi:MAG: hypothetical protein QOE59_1400 [Actinomycetota bacterium]|jgi:hypothetical protein|nr:hypothetical protein [Actinomycetota bacterium]
MPNPTRHPPAAPGPSTSRPVPHPPSRVLLGGGVVAGVLFPIVALLQALFRAGFDVVRYPLSLLSLGDLGWIQVGDFVVSGLLFTALAVGMRGTLAVGDPARTWGPVLTAVFGLGMVTAGICRTDPALGYPPGTPALTPTALSAAGWGHTAGFTLAFLALPAVCLVFARRFRVRSRPAAARACILTTVVIVLLVAVGMSVPPVAGLAFAAAGALACWWMAVIAADLLAAARTTPRGD